MTLMPRPTAGWAGPGRRGLVFEAEDAETTGGACVGGLRSPPWVTTWTSSFRDWLSALGCGEHRSAGSHPAGKDTAIARSTPLCKCAAQTQGPAPGGAAYLSGVNSAPMGWTKRDQGSLSPSPCWRRHLVTMTTPQICPPTHDNQKVEACLCLVQLKISPQKNQVNNNPVPKVV